MFVNRIDRSSVLDAENSRCRATRVGVIYGDHARNNLSNSKRASEQALAAPALRLGQLSSLAQSHPRPRPVVARHRLWNHSHGKTASGRHGLRHDQMPAAWERSRCLVAISQQLREALKKGQATVCAVEGLVLRAKSCRRL